MSEQNLNIYLNDSFFCCLSVPQINNLKVCDDIQKVVEEKLRGGYCLSYLNLQQRFSKSPKDPRRSLYNSRCSVFVTAGMCFSLYPGLRTKLEWHICSVRRILERKFSSNKYSYEYYYLHDLFLRTSKLFNKMIKI